MSCWAWLHELPHRLRPSAHTDVAITFACRLSKPFLVAKLTLKSLPWICLCSLSLSYFVILLITDQTMHYWACQHQGLTWLRNFVWIDSTNKLKPQHLLDGHNLFQGHWKVQWPSPRCKHHHPGCIFQWSSSHYYFRLATPPAAVARVWLDDSWSHSLPPT